MNIQGNYKQLLFLSDINLKLSWHFAAIVPSHINPGSVCVPIQVMVRHLQTRYQDAAASILIISPPLFQHSASAFSSLSPLSVGKLIHLLAQWPLYFLEYVHMCTHIYILRYQKNWGTKGDSAWASSQVSYLPGTG